MDLHKANGTVLGSINGTCKGKHYRLRPLQTEVKKPVLGRFCFVFWLCPHNKLKAEIYHKR